MDERKLFLFATVLIPMVLFTAILAETGIFAYLIRPLTIKSQKFALEIPKNQTALNYTFEQDFTIVREDYYQFLLSYSYHGMNQTHLIYDFFRNNPSMLADIKILDDQGHLIDFKEQVPNGIRRSTELTSVGLYGMRLNKGKYKIRINLSTRHNYVLKDIKTSLLITNGNNGK